VREVQLLQLTALCALGLPVHVCEWSTAGTTNSLFELGLSFVHVSEGSVIATIDSWFWTGIIRVKYRSYNWRLILNWDLQFMFVSELYLLQSTVDCELGYPFLRVCGWSTITTEYSLWTGISISSRLWVKYSYNWWLIVKWDFHFYAFVGEVQLHLMAHCELGIPFLRVCGWRTVTTEDSLWTWISISSRLWVKYNYNWRHCELGCPFLHFCGWSTITTEDSMWTGISISSRLWVKYSYNWRLIVDWDFHFFALVDEVHLHLMAHCELGFAFIRVCGWSTITTEDWLWTGISISSRLWVKYNYNCRLIVNWDFHFFAFLGEVQFQLKTDCELGFPFLRVCGWSTVTTEDSLSTRISISSRLWVKYNYNW